MTINPVVYLLITSSIFTMSVNAMYSEEVLVFHDSTTVYVLSTSPNGEPIKKELINNATSFRINNRSGYFIMSEGYSANRIWYKGRLDSSLNVTKQALPAIHPDVLSVAISGDGKRIAWGRSEGVQKSELTIEEHIGVESKILRKISIDGLIPAFSFSPNGELLAYFSGTPEDAVKNAFSLMLLDLTKPEKPPVEIAPLSLSLVTTSIGVISSGSRSAPSWLPDGKFIIFEARYKNEDSVTSKYVVSIDGHTLELYSWMEWVGDLKSGEFKITEIDVSSREEKSFTIELTTDTRSLSPSGRKIASVVNKEVFVYDTAEKTTVSYGTSQNSRGFFWLIPKD